MGCQNCFFETELFWKSRKTKYFSGRTANIHKKIDESCTFFNVQRDKKTTGKETVNIAGKSVSCEYLFIKFIGKYMYNKSLTKVKM